MDAIPWWLWHLTPAILSYLHVTGTLLFVLIMLCFLLLIIRLFFCQNEFKSDTWLILSISYFYVSLSTFFFLCHLSLSTEWNFLCHLSKIQNYRPSSNNDGCKRLSHFLIKCNDQIPSREITVIQNVSHSQFMAW